MNCTKSLEPPYKMLRTASKFSISVIEYILFDSIRISVKLCDDNNNIVDTKIYLLDGENYTKWETQYNGSDTYIINYIKECLYESTI